MSPSMQKKLQRNIDYHAAMAEHYTDLVKEAAEKAPPPSPPPAHGRDTRPTASASPPKPDSNKVLADLHTEVVKQLMPIINAGAQPSAIANAQAQQTIRRNPSGDVKPSAGRFN